MTCESMEHHVLTRLSENRVKVTARWNPEGHVHAAHRRGYHRASIPEKPNVNNHITLKAPVRPVPPESASAKKMTMIPFHS